MLRPYLVRNPQQQSDFYVVYSWECEYTDGSLDGTDDMLVREWQQQPDPDKLKPMLILASSYDRAMVSVCTSNCDAVSRRWH
jgi:hypothetical protein